MSPAPSPTRRVVFVAAGLLLGVVALGIGIAIATNDDNSDDTPASASQPATAAPTTEPASIEIPPTEVTAQYTNPEGDCPAMRASFTEDFELEVTRRTLRLTSQADGSSLVAGVDSKGNFTAAGSSDRFVGKITKVGITAVYEYASESGCEGSYDVSMPIP